MCDKSCLYVIAGYYALRSTISRHQTRASWAKSSASILQINGLIILAFIVNPSLFFSSLAGSFSVCQAKR